MVSSLSIVPDKTIDCNRKLSANNLKLFNIAQIEIEQINWLWNPYIPFGKITIIQGDGGCGKTTLTLAIAAALTRGSLLPETDTALEPGNVIFQTAEDGLADTIKPRLLQLGADCERIFVIDESNKMLSFGDIRIEQAILQTNSKLLILDPLQAYLGARVDMHRANEVRPAMKSLSNVALKTGCAIIIVGHLNKSEGKSSQYKGLGSIDIPAAARSVLTVGKIKGKPNFRAIVHSKSNLAPEGDSIAFELNNQIGFNWFGTYSITIDELLGNSLDKRTASELAEELLKKELSDTAILADEIINLAVEEGISKRTLDRAKSSLGVRSEKKGNQWFWKLESK